MTGPILLEGPDGSGKTTLAARLAKAAQTPDGLRFKNSAPGPDEPSLLMKYTRQLRRGAIIDRAWPSEFVYSGVMKRQPQLDLRKCTMLQNALECVGGAMIVCLPSFESCREAWAGRPDAELLKREGQLLQAWLTYANMFNGLRSSKIQGVGVGRDASIYLFDWTVEDADKDLDRWLATVDSSKSDAWRVL